jgi:Cof subfamily protein (haloacid dehalogenase superfamily)
MMLPLVILDIDGTMVGSSGQVQECVWQAVEKAKKQGVKFAVCTGRPGFGIAQRIAERLGNTHPHIFQNGAQLAFSSGEGVQVFALKEALSRQLMSYARSKNLVLELYTPNTLFIERKTPMSEAHARMIGVNAIVRDLEDVISREPVIRAQWVVPTGALDTVLACKPEGSKFGVASSPAQPDTYFVSVTKDIVSKGNAVQLLCETMKIPLTHVMAVGDSEGDLPMLERVGYPMVMANAEPSLLERFPVTEKTVEACGLVEAIKLALNTEAAKTSA